MRISCWLQLTLRCTILGLCPELFLFFLEAPPPQLLLAFAQPNLTKPHFVVRKASRGRRGAWKRSPSANSGLQSTLERRPGGPELRRRRMSGHLSWGVGAGDVLGK